MQIDRTSRWIIAAALFTMALPQISNATAPSKTTETKPPAGAPDQAAVYTCPMHPEVVSDKPGRCPKCGMKLVPKTTGTPAPEAPSAPKKK